MDLLQRELERKKLTLAKASKSSAASSGKKGDRKRKFLRQRDLRRLEEEEEEARLKQQQEERALSNKKKRAKLESASTDSADAAAAATTTSAKKRSDKNAKQKGSKTSAKTSLKKDSKNDSAASSSKTTNNNDEKTTSASSVKDVTQQLRALGLPIRFFGETQSQRLARLEQAMEQQTHVLQGLSEKEEFRLGKGHGIRNTFLDRDDNDDDEDHQGNDNRQSSSNNNNKKEDEQNKNNQKEEEDVDDDINGEKDPPKFIYKFLKGLLKQWEQDLASRPDTEARSAAGRNDAKTLKQCKDYIRPLFKLLKQRKLEAGLQAQLFKIVTFALEGEFVRAHDTYLDLAIGRAAWPIGVTMVGIHARSGRAKIESSNVAHVMNSELQRKYLTSVKRLLSYSQKKRPDVDPSKKVT
jgi:pre-mRNA-splicing factor 18